MRQIGCIIVNAMLLLAMAAGEAAAGPLEDGEAAYRHGEYPTAVQLLVPLAEQGNAAAQVTLGDMYVIGQGVLKDGVEAARWYRKAADQGSLKAEIDLAMMFQFGGLVDRNDVEASKWLGKAAEQGDDYAQHTMGVFYAVGKGVPKDNVLDYKWLNLASAQGYHGSAQLRDALATEMTPDQIAEAQRLAREWKPTK
jgi:TPR repeat protein